MPRYHGVVWCDSEGRGGALVERVDRTEVGYSTVHCTGQYSTVQGSTVQYSTVQYSQVQYSSNRRRKRKRRRRGGGVGDNISERSLGTDSYTGYTGPR